MLWTYIAQSSISWTRWYGQIKEENIDILAWLSPEANKLIWDWMRSYEDYLQHYNIGNKVWKQSLKNRLDSIAYALKKEYWKYVDPIKYLIKLYYIDEFSIIDVHKKIKKLNISKKLWNNENSLEKTFKKTFWWKLRGHSWSKLTRQKKTNQIQEAIKTNKSRIKEKHLKIENYIEEVKNKNKFLLKKEFNKNYFESLNNSSRKFLYLIDYIFWMKDVDIINIINLWCWVRLTSNFFNENKTIQRFLKKENINFSCNTRTIKTIIETSNWIHKISKNEKIRMLSLFVKHKIKNIIEYDFDIKNFNSLDKKEKILELIKVVLWLTKENLIFLRDELEIWTEILANYLNENKLLMDFKKRHNIEIKIIRKDFQTIFKEL